jgi:hypothetical protein
MARYAKENDYTITELHAKLQVFRSAKGNHFVADAALVGWLLWSYIHASRSQRYCDRQTKMGFPQKKESIRGIIERACSDAPPTLPHQAGQANSVPSKPLQSPDQPAPDSTGIQPQKFWSPKEERKK